MIENEKNTISKLDKEVAVIKTEISEIKDNHLAHIKKDIDFHFAKEMMDVIKVAVPGLNLDSKTKKTSAKTKK